MSTIAELTPTSFAILGLLALKPWTTYELAQQMERGLRSFWPRAQSKIYEEPKKLVAHGLAKASSEPVGRRPRTVYTITPKGRRALRSWLAEPGAGPVLEFEQLLKVFFADHTTTEVIRENVQLVREWAEAELEQGLAINRQYVDGEGPFQARAAHLVLVGRFLNDFALTVGRWAEWADTVIADWPDEPVAARPRLEVFEEMIEAADEFLGGRDRPAAEP
jgi:PadR family transcriptional regulator, regulatory protein AphA